MRLRNIMLAAAALFLTAQQCEAQSPDEAGPPPDVVIPPVEMPDLSLYLDHRRTSPDIGWIEFVDFEPFMPACTDPANPPKQVVTFSVPEGTRFLDVRVSTLGRRDQFKLSGAPWQIEIASPCPPTNPPPPNADYRYLWIKIAAFARVGSGLSFLGGWITTE